MAAAKEDKKWLPLESNPDVMNKFTYALGLSPLWAYTDVWGLEPELLVVIPRPVAAVLLLYPITDETEANDAAEIKRIELKGQKISDRVFFMKQYVGNACGTVGILHSVCNNLELLSVDEGYLREFAKATAGMSPAERGSYLEQDDAIESAHATAGEEGQTEAATADMNTNLHFVCLVHVDGGLYELDGRKPFPVRHGDTTADRLLDDSAEVVKQFMARTPGELSFNVIALAAAN